MIRVLRVIETGQWCGPAIEDGAFPDDGGAWADRVAVTLGLQPGSLTVVDGESDPRSGVLLPDPNITIAPAPKPDPDEELWSAIAAATDLADLKAALLGNKSQGKVKGQLA